VTDNIKCILDSNRGVYIPQNFVDDFDLSKFDGIESEDVKTCKLGPEAEWYWDSWESILNNAKYTDDDGIKWTLHHDGDLFLVAIDKLSDEDFEVFFEVARDE
jgi:hypothetical protein